MRKEETYMLPQSLGMLELSLFWEWATDRFGIDL
jgi:hypothetical protein